MKTLKKFDMRRFGTALVTLCLAGMPLLASAAEPLATPPTSPITGYLAPGETTRTPDYYTTANWANTPMLPKFVDTLPGLGSSKANSVGQYIPLGKPDITTYPGSDYYEIDLVEFRQRFHPDLPATTGPTTGTTTGTLLRGYVQVNKGTNISAGTLPSQGLCGADQHACTAADTLQTGLTPDPARYLGPTLIAEADRPVRVKFTNRLPANTPGNPAGDLFIPVDESVMGAGSGAANSVSARGDIGTPCNNTVEGNTCAKYPHNRATIHLHGGRTPWISDGTPHQWITPVEEITPFIKGVSAQNVPDMVDPGDGSMTFYYTNQQSARMMFYHDHAFGTTRLNVYVGEVAGYLITDKWEKDLVDRGLIPADQIPLIIQDKTFVDATPVTHPVTGQANVPQIRVTDPLWNWGSSAADGNGVKAPVTGDLWMPHVYMPAQNTNAGFGGVNPFGRWMYGPWFYPATAVEKGPKANPYYDADCSSPIPAVFAQCTTPGQPEQIPGTPNVSMGMEAFQDTVVVNGAVFPSLSVDPRAYRFRILNGASDRFWNLSFYVADPTPAPADGRRASNLTEVKMVPASAALAAANNWPADWPVDGRDGGVPDPGACAVGGINCPNLGPNFLQIATEGGFLPAPVVRTPQPVTYITDPTAFWVGVVDKTGLALGPAERADVIVDFSAYAGKTLILYNDAPAAWPARVPGYDYFTNAPDMRDSGGYGTGGTYDIPSGTWVGGTGPLPGFAPNTRTVMQVVVRPAVGTDPAYTFNQTNLEREFTVTAVPTAINPAPAKTLFERSQDPIIVGQQAYSTAYPGKYFPPNYPWEGISQINDQYLKFVTLAGEAVTAPQHPKGIHDEMGASFDPVYGRMSGNLAMQLPNPTTLNALLILYGFSDIPTETINNSTTVNVQVLGTPKNDDFLFDGANLNFTTNLGDGTQIWKISHNGVDTHPIHFHIFDVQLVNRVGWDGQIALPEPNELGWKDTIKISPLMDTIVAVRPRAPGLPFGITNSLRPLNPAIPIDSAMGFNSVDWKTGQARPTPVTNILYDFKWEYVWHCHILSHEEMDMMRPIVLNVVNNIPSAPTNFNASYANNSNNLTWTDPTPAASSMGNIANEVGFKIQRCTGGGCTNFTTIDTAIANSTSYRDFAINPNTTYRYRMFAFNAAGNSANTAIDNATSGATLTPTVSITAPVNNAVYNVGDTITINATATVPNGVTLNSVDFYDGATLLGSATTTPFSYVWTGATVGAHTLTARVNHSAGAAVVSGGVGVTVNAIPLTAAPTLIGPNGNVATVTPTYTWNAVSGATNYIIYTDNNGFTTFTAAAVGCPGGTGICSAALLTPLQVGISSGWTVRASNVAGLGPWALNSMSVTAISPQAPTLVGPNGVVLSATPTYTWNAVSGATNYTIYTDNNGFTTFTAIAAGCPLGTGTCSVTLPAPLQINIRSGWVVNASNAIGVSPWSTNSMSVTFGVSPAAPTLVGPNGIVLTANPTYVWNAVASATDYTIYTDNSGFTTFTAAAAGCPLGTGTCSISLATPLQVGITSGWVVKASNAAGVSQWSPNSMSVTRQ